MCKALLRIVVGFLFAVVSAWSSHAQLNPAKLTQYTEVNGVPGRSPEDSGGQAGLHLGGISEWPRKI